jgi:hypothetical protein
MNAKVTFVLSSIAIFFGSLAVTAEEEAPRRVHETFPKVRKAQTIEQQKISIGVSGGMAATEDRQNAPGYGVEAAFQPWIPFSAGLDLGGYVVPSSGANSTLTRTRLLARGQYNFGGTIPLIRHSWVGAGIGPVWDNVDNSTDVELGVAPAVGFDFFVDEEKKFTLGANANYMFVGGAKPDVFAVNGVAKYWFQ